VGHPYDRTMSRRVHAHGLRQAFDPEGLGHWRILTSATLVARRRTQRADRQGTRIPVISRSGEKVADYRREARPEVR
jgi:hypothetical protein